MVLITGVEQASHGEKAGLAAGDILETVNGNPVNDVLDYNFYIYEKSLVLRILRDNLPFEINIEKPEYDGLGLEFSSYLMDGKKSCRNRCMFCFIDQNPPGMRESVYFKDDDERLSFLQGNYVTLTNLGEREVSRIIKMRISPINISVHTADPVLRVKMMGNKNAGKALEYLKMFSDAGIAMNTQLVLCRGVNDGEHLERSLRCLMALETVESVAAVPAGLTGHREGLCHIEPYDRDSAAEVIEITEKFNKIVINETGLGKIYASDEFYILAEKELPSDEYYGEYSQLENGVGMTRLFIEEFQESLKKTKKAAAVKLSIATGEAAFEFIKALTDEFSAEFPEVEIFVYPIKNRFFGGSVTVSGLVTGGDIAEQLEGKTLGSRLFIPSNMLKADEPLFLDNVSLFQLEDVLKIKIIPVDGGAELCRYLAGGRLEKKK